MTIGDIEYREKANRLMDSGELPYLRVEDDGRFVVTNKILAASGYQCGQVLSLAAIRSVVQIYEAEILALHDDISQL